MTSRTTPDSGTDDFDISSVSSFIGYASSVDPTNSSDKILVRGSQNVYKKISGTIANRPGRKMYDVADATIAKCNTGYVWNTSFGVQIPIRCANSKLSFYSSITGTGVWYDLLTSLSNTRFVFDSWWDNTDKKSKLLSVSGAQGTVYDWAGGIALFVSYASTVITLDRNAATAGFASSGTVTIGGVDYTYSGISGSTLTGTSDASGATANAAVYSKIATITSFTSGPDTTYACDFIKVVENQLYIGSYTSQLVYMSKNTSYTDFSFSSPRLTGEGDIILLDDVGKGIGAIQGSAHIFYGTSWLTKITFNQITVGGTLSEVVKSEKVPLGQLIAAQGHEFISALGDNIIYLDQNNQVRSYGNFRNLFVAKAVLLSQALQEELAEESFTGGSLKVISDRRGDLIYINAPVSGKTYLYQERSGLDGAGNVIAERLWHPYQTWNITVVDTINGYTVGFSNENPQIYRLWDTGQWHDDSPNGSLPYNSIALMSYRNIGRRQGKLNFDKIYWEGYMTADSSVYGGAYYDYQGSQSLLSVIINDQSSLLNARQLFSGVVPPSLGDASLGDNPLGDGMNVLPDDQALLPKFRVITGVNQIDCYEYALMIYSTSVDSRWELLACGTSQSMSFAQGVELMK